MKLRKRYRSKRSILFSRMLRSSLLLPLGIVVLVILLLVANHYRSFKSYQTQAVANTFYTIQPLADAYVRAGSPNSNYGTAVSLITSTYDSSNIRRTFIKFDLSAFAGQTLTQAQLRLTPDLARTVDKQVKLVPNTGWIETTINWNNQPSMGSVLGALSSQPIVVGSPISINLDVNQLQPFVGNILSLGVDNLVGANTLSVSSREAAAGKPELLLEVAGGSGTPSPTPSASPVSSPSPSPSAVATPSPSSSVFPSSTPIPQPSASPGSGVTFVGAGDIAGCSSSGDEATANLLDQIPGTVFTLGDNVYENGTLTEFNNCYGPSWGRHKSRTQPSAGNHEYNTASAAGYYDYFGSAAGDRTKGYYSYNLGSWHVVVINSNCSTIGGCNAGSPQEKWLRQDLAANPTSCTLAYWHHPLFSSSGSSTNMKPIWQALYDYNAEIVLASHRHNYELFAPQTAAGVLDNARGIREFVVGTGGRSHHSFSSTKANSLVRNNDTYGVLQLTLKDTSYDWQFIPQAGKTFTDSGATDCH